MPDPPDQIDYPHLIATTIHLTVLPEGKTFEDLVDGDKVGFNEEEGNDSHVAFLKDIKQDPDASTEVSHRVYTATYVTPKTAAEIARKGWGEGGDSDCHPLFHVHGFNNEPNWTLGATMQRAMENCAKTKKNYPIPVIWPVHGNNFPGYKIDATYNSIRAGKNLKALVDTIPNDVFPVKSIMCHSMGNHVVFDGALAGPVAPDVKFKNVFLVGAVSNSPRTDRTTPSRCHCHCHCCCPTNKQTNQHAYKDTHTRTHSPTLRRPLFQISLSCFFDARISRGPSSVPIRRITRRPRT